MLLIIYSLIISLTLGSRYRDNYNRDIYVCEIGRTWYFGITDPNNEPTPSPKVISFATASLTKPNQNPFTNSTKLVGLFFGMPYQPPASQIPEGGALQFLLEKDTEGNNFVGTLGTYPWELTFVDNNEYSNGLCYNPTHSNTDMTALWSRIIPNPGDPDPFGPPINDGVVPFLEVQLCNNGIGFLWERNFFTNQLTFESRLQGNFVYGGKAFVGIQEFVGSFSGILNQIFILTGSNELQGNFQFQEFVGSPETYERSGRGNRRLCGYDD